MRRVWHLWVGAAALILFSECLVLSADAHVMGVDFGSEFIKVAAPRSDQSIDIVLNELSRRKTDNYVAFHNGDRYIGDQAKGIAARFPLKSACAINHIVGLHQAAPELEEFQSRIYEYNIEFDSRGSVLVPIADPNGPFTAQELYGMLLAYVHQITVHSGTPDPRGVVVTIPFRTSIRERRAILDAAKLGDTTVLGFIHSTTAAALYYGMRRRGFGNRTVHLVVFDVGSTHTEAGVYSFTPPAGNAPMSDAFGTLSTRIILEDKTLGGRAFDLCIARAIEREAVRQMGIDPIIGQRSAAQQKSQFSLMRAASKVREVLSVNSQTPFTVEGIAPERDFQSTMNRNTFERECAPLFERVRKLASEVMTTSGLKASEIHAFELMGGVARTPKIIALLSSLLGREVDRTMNMDEAAAMGASYLAVRLSPFYRVKSFLLKEQVPFELYFSVLPPVSAGKHSSHRPLFGNYSMIGESASVSLKRTDDFVLQLFEAADKSSRPVAEVKVHDVRKALEKMDYFTPSLPHANHSHIIRLQLRVNEAGLVEMEEAVAVVRYAVNVTRKVPVAEDSEGGSTKVVQPEHTIKTKTKSVPLSTTLSWLHPTELPREVLESSKRKVERIEAVVQSKLMRAVAKNNLESYIFSAKGEGLLENETASAGFGTALIERLTSLLQDASEWLEDGEGGDDSCTKEMYEAKLDNLTSLIHQLTREEARRHTATSDTDDGDL